MNKVKLSLLDFLYIVDDYEYLRVFYPSGNNVLYEGFATDLIVNYLLFNRNFNNLFIDHIFTKPISSSDNLVDPYDEIDINLDTIIYIALCE